MSSVEAKSVKNLLDSVHMGVAVIRLAKRKFARELAPDFRIFEQFRIDENALSRCFATLLDPGGSHGQKDDFLRAFLRRVQADSFKQSELEDVRVSLEHGTDHDRRIDIVLQNDDRVIGIENKPWAGDQERQLADYARYLELISKGRDRDWLLIFLSNREPSEESLPSEVRTKIEKQEKAEFVIVDYEVVADWLDECLQLARAQSVRVFVQELAQFVRSNINGEIDVTEMNEVKDAVLKSAESLESAFLIGNAIHEVKSSLFEKLHVDLAAACEQRGWALDWIANDKQGKRWSQFLVRCNKSARVAIGFEFTGSEFNGLEWGFPAVSGAKASEFEGTGLKERIQSKFGLGWEHEFWVWYQGVDQCSDIGPDFKNWRDNPKPWIAIRDGSLVDMIINLCLRACEILLEQPVKKEAPAS